MSKLMICLFRHGAKNKNGTLSELGEIQARKYGSDLNIEDDTKVEIYSSSKERVKKTTEIIVASCQDVSVHTDIKEEEALSIEAVLYNPKKSNFFHRYSQYPVNNSEDVHRMEEDRMSSWLSFKQQPDPGTASPEQVFIDLIAFFKKSAERVNPPNNFSGNTAFFLCGTHEFMIATLVYHLVEDFSIEEIGRINYLEDINIFIDTERMELTSVEFRNKKYSTELSL